MPKVGSKHYAYTPSGRAAAAKAAKATGRKVSNTKRRSPKKK